MSSEFGGMRVSIAMPVHRDVPPQTVLALSATVAACTRMNVPCRVIMPLNGSVVTVARNRCADEFLKTDDTHLFWIDSDQEWDVDAFFKILSLARTKHVARASYPRKRDEIMFEADGLGFCCVQREVMQALANKAPTVWFGEGEPCTLIFEERYFRTQKAEDAGADYEFLAEDTSFFAKVHHLGFKCWLDPHVDVGHVGQKVYRGSMAEYLDGLKETDDAQSTKQTHGAAA